MALSPSRRSATDVPPKTAMIARRSLASYPRVSDQQMGFFRKKFLAKPNYFLTLEISYYIIICKIKFYSIKKRVTFIL